MSRLGKIAGMALSGMAGAAAGAAYEWINQEKRIDRIEDHGKKMQCYNDLLTQWLILKQDGKNLKEYFEFNGYHTIAIYGMAELGRRLMDELRDTDIAVRYIVDRNADNLEVDLPKFKPDDRLEKVDALVITAIYSCQDIVEEMESKVDFHMVSLEDVVYGMA